MKSFLTALILILIWLPFMLIANLIDWLKHIKPNTKEPN